MQKINVALSGSGVRFPYFIGALQYLYNYDYKIVNIAGTSGGSLVSAMVASSARLNKLIDFGINFQFNQILKHNCKVFNSPEIYKWNEIKFYNRLEDFDIDPDIDISTLKIGLKIVTNNISKMNIQIFNSGILYKLVLASMSVPFIIRPVVINNNYYVDGGLSANFGINLWDTACYPTIGFDIKSEHTDYVKPNSIIGYVERNFETAMNAQETIAIDIAKSVKTNTVVVPLYCKYSSFDLTIDKEKAKTMIDSGYNQTKQFFEQNEIPHSIKRKP